MTTYRLARRRPEAVVAPQLDDRQRAVVEHGGGPLLVLAGPGTGKTTTLVEAIVDAVDRRGVDPAAVLALTFSRKAAEQLRDRVTARLGRTLGASLASTFHSFAYGLVRAYSPPSRAPEPLRLLSAAEQDVVLRELLAPAPEAVRWPPSLAAALGTRGFAAEVHAVLARAREKGLDAAALTQVGEADDRPEWVAAGRFLQQYLDVLDSESAVDYPNLVFEAVNIATTPRVQAELRARYSHVFVDEYQDTDPSQVALLRALAGDGRNLVVVGDPDQSIYGFRGADLGGLLAFPDVFRTTTGTAAPVVALGETRRFGTDLLAASRRIAGALPRRGHIPQEAWDAFRNPVAQPGLPPGRVDVVTYDTARTETEHIADALRRAHLDDGLPWSEMAVLVRSGRATIPAMRRALVSAGVPVDVASDETPLVREPAVLPLLDALRAVVNLENEDTSDPDYLDPTRAQSLMLSPVGGMDAADVRALGRALRHREDTGAGRRRTSAELLRAGLTEPGLLDELSGPGARRARRLVALLREARAQVEAQATAEEVLWTLWSGTDWPARLRRSATSGGPGALMAHRDLDAVCALFDAAARAEERRGATSVAAFLDLLTAQQIPADTLAEQGVRGDAVRLLTAHRSKGLEWRYVVVAHVQEGSWPDLRRRATLLHADEIGVTGAVPPVTTRELLAEERRLFYVACTRARERLLVTAVRSTDEEGEQPSRFLADLCEEDHVRHERGLPRRPLSLKGLVAELRRTVTDETAPKALRRAAARRLALLAAETDRGRPLVPEADPVSWWGLRARSRSATPVRPQGEPVYVSASALEALLVCPARWFLEREAGGAVPSTSAQGFGLVVHALADRVAKGELTEETTVEDLMPYVEQVWSQLSFRTPWSAERERANVRAALERFLQWHRSDQARRVLATEQKLDADVTLPDGETVHLHGYADRLEVDDDGQVWVVDLKTTKYPPTNASVAAHPQLGLYQLAVEHGAADDLVGGPASPGGAELVHLRGDLGKPAKVQRQAAQEPDEDGSRLIERQLMQAVRAIRDEEFPAVSGEHCTRCTFTALCPAQARGQVLA